MSVYIDNQFAGYGRMLMSHMIADTHDELTDMAKAIGVPVRHIQYEGTAREHFDVCKSMRNRAIVRGAIAVSVRELVRMIQYRERNGRLWNPEHYP